VRIHWTEWVVLASMTGAACIAVCGAMTRMMRRAVAEKQRETDRQLSAMAATVRALQARLAELGGLATQQGVGVIPGPLTRDLHPTDVDLSVGTPDLGHPAEGAGGQPAESAETIAVLAAAAAAIVGNKARIRSARLLSVEPSGAGTWAQQGRAFVQTSHNPRART